MKHLMIDIETLDNKVSSVITSIAAVPFDIEEGVSKEVFNIRVNIQDCIDHGLTISGDTIKWWLAQNEKARELIYSTTGQDLELGLTRLALFIKANCVENVQVWGNSNRFDLGILANAYNKINQPLPWKYWDERDVRTLVSLAPEYKLNHVFFGDAHDPLNDCYNQIKYCRDIFNHFNLK